MDEISSFAGARIRSTLVDRRMVKMMTPGYKGLTSRSSRASTTADAANSRVGNVAIRSRTVLGSIVVTLERGGGLVLPLATSAIDVALGASHSLRFALHGYGVAPFGHPPHATALKVRGQVGASSGVVIETAVLLAPTGDVAVGPLVLAALGHGPNAHPGYEDVEAIARDIAAVVDDLVEERVDLARFGPGELGDVTGALVLVLGGAGHGRKCVAHLRVDIIRPGLLATALILPATTTTGRVAIVSLGSSDDGFAVGETSGDRVVHRSLVKPSAAGFATIPVHRCVGSHNGGGREEADA